MQEPRDPAHRQQGIVGGDEESESQDRPAKLDIGTLKPGDVIEGRYKFIERSAKVRSAPCS